MNLFKYVYASLFEFTEDEVKYKISTVNTEFDNDTSETEIIISEATKFLGFKFWSKLDYSNFDTVEQAIDAIKRIDERKKKPISQQKQEFKII